MDDMNFQEFLKRVYRADCMKDSASREEIAKTTGYLEEGQDSMGGALVPTEAFNRILDVTAEESIVRPQAKVIGMTSDRITISRGVDSTHASSVLGGIVCYWGTEGGSMSESNPAFGTMNLVARNLYGYCYTSVELMEDTIISAEDFLIAAFGEALAWYSDAAYFTGTGINEPLGVINAPCHILVAAEGSQTADTVFEENIKKMDARLDPRSEYRAKWYINQEVKAQLHPLQNATPADSLTQPQTGDDGRYFLLGHPIYVTEKCPKLGDHGDIILGDFSRYLIADRGLAVSASDHFRFQYNLITWRFVYRGDGQPIPADAYIPKNATSSTTVSPFITLAERA